MTNTVTIHRSNRYTRQRETSVRLEGALNNLVVDPVAQVRWVTHTVFDRYNSILSFAAGIQCVGWEVYLQNDGEPSQRFLNVNRVVHLPFWLLGFCLARKRGEWAGFKISLDRYGISHPEQRTKALNGTADHFLKHLPSWEESLYLILK